MNTSNPSAPESPAKEQPGEQSDVAGMVKRLREAPLHWLASTGETVINITFTTAEREILLAKLGQGWIPVSERLPEHGVDVMIYHVLGDRDRAEVPHAYDVGWLLKDGWYFPWDRGRDRQRPMFVTHWMPLPPPPPERP